MTVVLIAMLAGLPYMGLRGAILTHPTIAEDLAPCSEVSGNFRQQQGTKKPKHYASETATQTLPCGHHLNTSYGGSFVALRTRFISSCLAHIVYATRQLAVDQRPNNYGSVEHEPPQARQVDVLVAFL